MAEFDINATVTTILVAAATLAAGGVWLRDYLKSRSLTDANRDAAINGVEINQSVLKNIRDELDRHSKRIAELEQRVGELTEKLANVRIIALDCYQLATECECPSGARERLLQHLRQIIKDA